jgi:Ser/Thr protein kinase RdoA (MazF antagonist)
METWQRALEAYPIGEVRECKPVVVGLIHQTYRIVCAEGVYSLQGLHPKLANDGIMADYEVVNRALIERELPVPRLVWARDGKSFHQDETGKRWRLTTWLEGQCLEAPKDAEMVHSAAALLGRFHAKMADLEYAFQSTHPLHKTEHHLARLQEVSRTFQESPLWADIAEMAAQVQTDIVPLLLPSELPRGVVHGDPKISNLLFDAEDRAVALIDLDTCNRHSVLVDVGDAVRSWCRQGSEDREQPFSLERFRALIEGYASTYPSLSAAERAFLPHAGRLITLELTARFLTDYLEDSYFGWNADQYPSRRAHNLARARAMLTLAQEMKAQVDTLTEIVKQAF